MNQIRKKRDIKQNQTLVKIVQFGFRKLKNHQFQLRILPPVDGPQ